MIRRNPNKANMSLVNSAQEEHLTVSDGIVTSAPVTNLKTVKNSENFELDKDGSYLLRKPLVLKEIIPNKETYYMYDKETKISYADGHLNVLSDEDAIIKLKFYDLHDKEHTIPYLSGYNFITEFISTYNALDHTLISAKINHNIFFNQTSYNLVHKPNEYNPFLYRFIKIYKDTDLGDNVWVIEIVHPEFNSITASLDTNAPDFNMLLDNPYAIRDLYGYGYVSATKIVSYLPIGYSTSEINTGEFALHMLTESPLINNKGFKIMVSSNHTVANGPIILKAFITAKLLTNIEKYYVCWERSETGAEWEECPEFLNKFSANAYVKKKISDLTSADFEKTIFAESLESASSYLVTKTLYPISTNTFNNEDDLIKNRPDVLVISSTNLKYKYRFQVYFDTLKSPENKCVAKYSTKNYFETTNLNNVTENNSYLDDVEKAYFYYTEVCKGRNFVDNQNSQEKSPDIDGGRIILHPGEYVSGNDSYAGNCLSIKPNLEKRPRLKKIVIKLADKEKTFDTDSNTYEYSQESAGIGWHISYSNEYGIFGGYLQANSNDQTLINTIYFKENTSDNFYQKLESMKSDTGGWYWGIYYSGHGTNMNGHVWLENVEYATNAWDVDQSYVDIHLGYKDISGYFFIVTEAGMFAGEPVSVGQAVVATPNGWVILSEPPLPLSAYTDVATEKYPRVGDLVNSKIALSSEDIVIDLTETDTTTVSELKIYCTSSAYFPESDVKDHLLRIASITLDYEAPIINVETTSIYLTSSAGPAQIEYSTNTTVVEDISKQRKDIFYGKMVFEKSSYKFFAKDKVYYTDPDSFIIKMLNVLKFSSTVTKVLPYRNYYLIFTNKDVSLVRYNEDGTYSTKIISNSVGLPEVDADTATVILNSIYFKSETKIFKLVPNLYASTEDVIDIKLVSSPIDSLFTHIVDTTFETSNFAYSDTDTYRVFIPSGNSLTYCFVYYLEKKAWILLKYPVALTRIERNTLNKSYVVKETSIGNFTGCGIYHFKEDINTLLETIRIQDFARIGAIDISNDEAITEIKVKYLDEFNQETIRPVIYGKSAYTYIDSNNVYSKIPYGDYMSKTPQELYQVVNAESLSLMRDDTNVDLSELNITPISFNIDFGQKSSNYIVDKQFLETKFIFATLHPKDLFPVTVDIFTDGFQKPLHWDCNTDSALWKETLAYIGTLNTTFQEDNSIYDGIMRQLIIKYSGKGKTARHIISGESKYRFKFISMNTRYRVLPKKQ